MIKKSVRDNVHQRIRREMSSLEQSTSPTKDLEPLPKRRMLDFDESDDEEDEETDALDAELRRF